MGIEGVATGVAATSRSAPTVSTRQAAGVHSAEPSQPGFQRVHDKPERR